MSNLLLKELKEVRKSNELIEIYLNPDDIEAFSVGYINAISKDFILVKFVYSTGIYDGYGVISINDIYKIIRNSKYLDTIIKLIEYNKSQFPDINLVNDNLLLSLLKYSNDNSKIVEVQMKNDEDYMVGFVKSITETTLEITKINNYGESNGKVTVRLKDIKMLQSDIFYYYRRAMLFKINNSI